MSVETVKAYFAQFDMEDRVREARETSATVEDAAKALNCEQERIAKTLSFHVAGRIILIVTAGDMKIDNKKYRSYFEIKPQMLKLEEVEPLVGHEVGGVCAFGIHGGIDVYLDVSMKRFSTVFSAAGDGNSTIELTLDELQQYSNSSAWVDVCKEKIQS